MFLEKWKRSGLTNGIGFSWRIILLGKNGKKTHTDKQILLDSSFHIFVFVLRQDLG
jgi:hypothetical protein